MQKGDDNQQQHSPKSEEISEYSATTLLYNGVPYTSIISSGDGPSYTDIVKVLSQVELPSPSPVLATSCNLISFPEGQSSGTKKVDEIEGNVERETDLKDKHGNLQETGSQFVASPAHSTRRRRSRIHEKIRALKAIVPKCEKRDQASILDDAIKHIKSLQMQVQMMQSMGAGTMPQGLYMSPGRQQSLQGPYLAPYFTMRPMIGVGDNTGHSSSYFTSRFPTCPPFIRGFNPLVPSMEVGTGASRLLPIPHLQHPSQASEPVYSTTFFSDTIIPTIDLEVGSGITSLYSYHMSVTSQEMQ